MTYTYRWEVGKTRVTVAGTNQQSRSRFGFRKQIFSDEVGIGSNRFDGDE